MIPSPLSTDSHTRYWRVLALLLVITLIITIRSAQPSTAASSDLIGPPGSGSFGHSVAVLSNGNIVVADPWFDAPNGPVDVGAVYLYDGTNHTLISRLTGSNAGDKVGVGGILPLTNGNYVIGSPYWNDGDRVDVGAVTWADGTQGITGTVSPANSLVGATTDNLLGGSYKTIIPLSTGHYVVTSWGWDNGTELQAGAITWADGTQGITGTVSPANSLVGSTAEDRIGSHGIVELGNGHFLALSPNWDNGTEQDAGAVTWFNGTGGKIGTLSAANSLVGSKANDSKDMEITVLPSGNYVVATPFWNNGVQLDVGAATWGNGTAGIHGPISSAISLVGSTDNDQVSGGGITKLANGHYVVRSPKWNAGQVVDVGAATWGNQTQGVRGPVSSTNSLIGSQTGDEIGFNVCALTNGNYVVSGEQWDNGTVANAGAFTWANGTHGITGTVSTDNSLVGSSPGDGTNLTIITALANGHYVIKTPGWDNGTVVDVGAITWGDGTTGTRGVISSTISLVGSQANDLVGFAGGVALPNGNYVARSVHWANGSATKAGAITWIDGTHGLTGTISIANSLIGTQTNDQVGHYIPMVVGDSNYVVAHPFWDNGAEEDAGAVTWADGSQPITGTISINNSLLGSKRHDGIGSGWVKPLANGNYIVLSPAWDNGLVTNAGAFTWGDGTQPLVGVVSSENSLVGSTTDDANWPTRVEAFPDGGYVLITPNWDHGPAIDAGAITWGNGTTILSGTISTATSLVGSTSYDSLGWNGEHYGNSYLSISRNWDRELISDAGAVTLIGSQKGITGTVADTNSSLGNLNGSGVMFKVAANSDGSQVVIGWPTENRVSFLTLSSSQSQIFVPFMSR